MKGSRLEGASAEVLKESKGEQQRAEHGVRRSFAIAQGSSLNGSYHFQRHALILRNIT